MLLSGQMKLPWIPGDPERDVVLVVVLVIIPESVLL